MMGPIERQNVAVDGSFDHFSFTCSGRSDKAKNCVLRDPADVSASLYEVDKRDDIFILGCGHTAGNRFGAGASQQNRVCAVAVTNVKRAVIDHELCVDQIFF